MNRLKKVTACLWLVLFVITYSIISLKNTMITSMIDFSPYLFFAMDALILISIIDAVLKYALERNGNPRKSLLFFLFKLGLIAAAYYLIFLTSANKDSVNIWLMILFAITADNWEEDKLLRIGLMIGVMTVVLAFVLAMLGIVENNRGNSFGFSYRTHYACFLMCMAMAWCILKDGRFTWLGELGLLALGGYMLFAVRGKTAFICVAVMSLFTFWRHYRDNGGVPFQERGRYGVVIPIVFRIIYFPVRILDWLARKLRLARKKQLALSLMSYSFPISAAIIFLLTFSYKFFHLQWNKLSFIGTFVSRLYLVQLAFEEFPLTLFGNFVSLAGFSGSEKAIPLYYAIDGAYPKLLIQFGVVFLALVVGLMLFAQRRLYKQKRYYAVFVLTIFAIDQTAEYWMINLAYNLFILLAFCKLSKKKGIEACDGLSLENINATKRAGIAAGAAVLCVLVGVWSFTAYQITSWRGWTPDYGATVVIPGDYFDRVKSEELRVTRLERAARYLSFRPEANCIVASEEDAKWLEARDIQKDRILVDSESSDIDSMLSNAADMIASMGLPNRLTVCAYDVQQCVVSRHASDLHIPVNSLAMKVPAGKYLSVFTAEQWRLLCGK